MVVIMGIQEEIVVSAYGGFTSHCRTVRHPAPEADAVLLMGGAFQAKEAWGPLEAALAESFTVVTVDLPGWGNADTLPESYGMDFLSDALHALLTDAGHRRLHVFGGSYSSAIAYRYAQKFPEFLQRLALAGPINRLTPQIRYVLQHTLELLDAGLMHDFAEFSVRNVISGVAVRPARQAAVRRILYNLFSSPSAAQQAKFRHNTLRLLNQPLQYRWPSITVPVLVTAGERDTFTPPYLCREVALTCSDARFIQLRDAGHAVHIEVPGQLADLLTRFYAGQATDDLPYCTDDSQGSPAGQWPDCHAASSPTTSLSRLPRASSYS